VTACLLLAGLEAREMPFARYTQRLSSLQRKFAEATPQTRLACLHSLHRHSEWSIARTTKYRCDADALRGKTKKIEMMKPTYIVHKQTGNTGRINGFKNSFETMNITESLHDSLDGGSARSNAATYTGQHKHRINADIQPSLEWDSNPRSKCLSRRRHFMP
jgi:hypothetical protein